VRVLLVSANRLRFPYPVYPIGLDHVAGALAPRHAVRVLDLGPVAPADEAAAIGAAVADHAPEVVGLSIRNVDDSDATAPHGFVEDARRVVAHLRAATAAPVVLGGAGYTLYPDELLAATGADYGIVGEGERAAALLDALAAGRSPEGLPGVALPGRSAALPPPLEDGARPPRAVAANPAIGHYVARGGVLNLQTQRGCPFRCIYCTYPAIEGRRLRTFDPDAVAREALALEAAGARFLFLTDSVFNANAAHAMAVAAAFRRAGLRAPWGAYFAPFAPPDGFWARMAEGGCTHAEFGTESLCDAMLGRLGKSFRREDALAAHGAARAAGIHVAHFFLLGGPDETAETLDETLDGAELLAGAALFFFCGMRVYRGTELERIERRAGRIAPGRSLLDPVFYEPPGLPLAAIEARVRARAAGRASWMIGDGAARAARLLERWHERGEVGPLWERLVDA
jgi:radical SAM superfamily enzyme YgiQ (UPF0313 family)